MPGKKAVVTLYPVGPVNPTTPRTLTFRSDADYVEIGRASKRESKNLLPQPNNALFDSRVMSRNHAKMWAAMDRKLIYIRDNDSMHGTWMDGSKLPVDEKVIIPNGAIIAFGVEVVRGRDTFPPLEVRCEYDWIESSDKPSQRNDIEPLQPTNTFCVPDAEDDEEVQILNGPIIGDNSDSDHSNSGPESDSEDMSVVEIPSPFTSPPKCDQHELTGTQQSPIEVDSEHEEEEQERQPLATPRMTPTPTSCVASHDETEVVDNTTHETDAPPAPQSPNEEQSSKDLHDWEADQDEESDDVSDDQSLCYSEESSSVSSGPEPDSQYIESAHIETSRPSFEFSGSVLPTTTTTMHTSSGPLPSPSDLLKLSYDTFPHGPFTPALNGWSSRSALNAPLAPLVSKCGGARPPYTDGPFCAMQVPRFVPPNALTCSNEKPSGNGPTEADKPTLQAEQVEWPPRSNNHPRASANTLGQHDSIQKGLKRKVEEIEDPRRTLPLMDGFSHPSKIMLSGESLATQSQAAGNDHEETYLPDAQPQPTVESLIRSGSPFSDLSPSSQAKENEQPAEEMNERPPKRLKTSGPSTLRAHATGAVVGAVVGAMGTIALLASLPQDYFL
ncbi:FHA domain protein [Aspergillus terreus]|uniref:FHA domain protein n=1 Tax=Aspergillus terreus TaxID=33178 RepID=A0A5M3ZAT8_ASPTE|nr:hypothetical protein ATETN484_0013019900 [Aspergillus terreus]GFF20433.1 FHA domain protein [Aspergillus terreus]